MQMDQKRSVNKQSWREKDALSVQTQCFDFIRVLYTGVVLISPANVTTTFSSTSCYRMPKCQHAGCSCSSQTTLHGKGGRHLRKFQVSSQPVQRLINPNRSPNLSASTSDDDAFPLFRKAHFGVCARGRSEHDLRDQVGGGGCWFEFQIASMDFEKGAGLPVWSIGSGPSQKSEGEWRSC